MMDYGWDTTAREVVKDLDLRGRKVVITGASSGLGVETARALGSTGADLVLGVRDLAKGEDAAFAISDDITGSMVVDDLELCDLASVAAFVRRIDGPVDCLIANAGVSKTPDVHLPNGLDVRFATNHLGHFLLANLLRPQLAHRGARIVAVSSAAHKGNPVRLEDLQWQKRSFAFGTAYGESKSANILFAQEATRRWGESGIFANAVLPGTALTGLQRYHGEELIRQIGFFKEDGTASDIVKTTEQAAATSVWAATLPALDKVGGLVLEDCGLAEVAGPQTHPWMGFDSAVADDYTARALWECSIDLVRQQGIDMPAD